MFAGNKILGQCVHVVCVAKRSSSPELHYITPEEKYGHQPWSTGWFKIHVPRQ